MVVKSERSVLHVFHYQQYQQPQGITNLEPGYLHRFLHALFEVNPIQEYRPQENQINNKHEDEQY